MRRHRIMTADGVRWDRERPRTTPTYKPDPSLVAEVALYMLRLERWHRDQHPTRDRALDDADQSIAGWRERADEAIHYHYPRKAVA